MTRSTATRGRRAAGTPEPADRLDALVADLPAAESALVSAASSLVGLLGANAGTADTTRRLPPDVVTALREEGLFRLATPREFGGHQAGACAATAIAAELARGCSSASWVLVVSYSAGLGLRLFPDAVRRRVWAEDPDAIVCGSSAGAVPARAVDGGYLLRGRWGRASGAHHASWAILDIVVGADGPAPERSVALVPMAELSLEDTWDPVGMRGTGSDTIVADEVHVPRERTVVVPASAGAGPTAPEPPARAPLPRPQGLMGTLVAPVLGMGMATYDHIVATLVDGRPLTSAASRHARAVDAPGVRANVADAAMLVDSAILHAARSARAVDRATGTGTRMSPLAAARIRMDAGFAARQVRHAVDALLDVGGAGRLAESGPAQRIWRDLGTATRHPAFVTEIDRERYARMLLGLDGP